MQIKLTPFVIRNSMSLSGGPFSFCCQLDDLAAAQRFVLEYEKASADETSAQRIHRVTRYLASEEPGCLGSDLRRYAAGEAMSERLRSEITAYQLCMLDDSMQEGPHALVSHTAVAARSSRTPWWSATIRLQQNLTAWEQSGQETPQLFERLFRVWKRLAQRRVGRIRYNLAPVRMSAISFKAFVYRTG